MILQGFTIGYVGKELLGVKNLKEIIGHLSGLFLSLGEVNASVYIVVFLPI